MIIPLAWSRAASRPTPRLRAPTATPTARADAAPDAMQDGGWTRALDQCARRSNDAYVRFSVRPDRRRNREAARMLGGRSSVAWLLALAATLATIPELLRRRDDYTRLLHPRPPIPQLGKILTVTLDSAAVQRVVQGGNVPAEAFARSFDMYYEAQLDDCHRESR